MYTSVIPDPEVRQYQNIENNSPADEEDYEDVENTIQNIDASGHEYAETIDVKNDAYECLDASRRDVNVSKPYDELDVNATKRY